MTNCTQIHHVLPHRPCLCTFFLPQQLPSADFDFTLKLALLLALRFEPLSEGPTRSPFTLYPCSWACTSSSESHRRTYGDSFPGFATDTAVEPFCTASTNLKCPRLCGTEPGKTQFSTEMNVPERVSSIGQKFMRF